MTQKVKSDILIKWGDASEIMFGTEWGDVRRDDWCKLEIKHYMKEIYPKCYVEFRQSKHKRAGKFYQECCVKEK